jgi:lipid II isoglutaminyl synthase (glutamine-hydrolysing)
VAATLASEHPEARRSPLRLRVAVPAARLARSLSRHLARRDGAVIGGRVCLAVDHDAVAHLLARHPTSVFVSATNGKTTTAALIAAAIGHLEPVATNTTGANLPSGVVTALMEAQPGATAVLEVDERYLPGVVKVAHRPVVCLLNLSRDQLDRMAEVRSISLRWRAAFANDTTRVIANADDPLVAFAAPPGRTTWVAAGNRWRMDALSCPACTARVEYDGDDWHCSACDLRRPHPDVTFDETHVTLASGTRIALPRTLPGAHSRGNAAFALAALELLGRPLDGAPEAMATVVDVDGRYLRLWGGDSASRLYLGKNPAGWAEILDVLAPVDRPIVIAVNGNDADGRDLSWLWDVPFERLGARPVVATGERMRDLAVRLRYADVEHITEPDLGAALGWARRRRADIVGTYTAFQQIKRELRRGE